MSFNCSCCRTYWDMVDAEKWKSKHIPFFMTSGVIKKNYALKLIIIIIIKIIIIEYSRYPMAYKKLLKTLWPFFMDGVQLPRGYRAIRDSLLFTTKFPETPGTHFTDLGRMKGWVNLGATQQIWTQESSLLTPRPMLHDNSTHVKSISLKWHWRCSTWPSSNWLNAWILFGLSNSTMTYFIIRKISIKPS